MKFSEIPIVGEDEYPADKSVKLDGPPGTGKTTQTLRRLMRYSDDKDLNPREILLVTYRRSLAMDAVERMESHGILPESFNHSQSYIGTIHAICYRLVQECPKIDATQMVTGKHKRRFCAEYGFEYGTDYGKSEGEVLFDAFSYMLSNDVSAANLPDHIYDDVQEVFFPRTLNIQQYYDLWMEFKSNASEHFEDIDEDEELYDFDELLYIVREFELTPESIKIAVIDEVHDVYPIMYDVIDMWISAVDDDTPVIVAGDPLQVINSYQGSSAEFYRNIDLPEIQLPTTWRCPESHFEYAKEVVSNHFEPPSTTPQSEDGEIEDVVGASMRYDRESESWKIRQNGKTPSDLYTQGEETLYLCRTRHMAEAIATDLDRQGVIYRSDSVSDDWVSGGRLDLYNAICAVSEVPPDPDTTWDGGNLALDIDSNRALTSEELQEFISAVSADYISEFKTKAMELAQNVNEYPVQNLGNILTDDFWSDFEDNPVGTLIGSVNKTVLRSALYVNEFEPIAHDDIPARILTIHGSKGMQAENVVLYDAITPRIEQSISRKLPSENECRTWYVGCTRSSHSLTIVRDAFEDTSSSPYLPPVQTADQTDDSTNGETQ